MAQAASELKALALEETELQQKEAALLSALETDGVALLAMGAAEAEAKLDEVRGQHLPGSPLISTDLPCSPLISRALH